MGLPDHLGGFVEDGDPATYFPELWSWIVEKENITSVLDIGCGSGIALNYFAEVQNCHVTGIDGAPQDDERIIEWDFTKGPLMTNDEFDLAWSCEFVEHVEDRYVPNFLETLRSAKLILMTHADPGQPGHHHVNCQPSGYWIQKLEAADFRLDTQLTLDTRQQAMENRFWWRDGWCSDTWWGFHVNHYVRSGLAFRRF